MLGLRLLMLSYGAKPFIQSRIEAVFSPFPQECYGLQNDSLQHCGLRLGLSAAWQSSQRADVSGRMCALLLKGYD